MGQPLTSCELNGTCRPYKPAENYKQPEEPTRWNSCASDAYCRPSSVGVTTSVDGQDKKGYDTMVAKIPYSDKNYGQALKDALEQKKPVVAIFGSWDKNNSRGLLQDALPGGGQSKDAIYLYIDPAKCDDPALKKFAEQQLAGGHNATATIVFDVKQDKDGNAQPNEYKYRWIGDSKSMVPSFQQAVADATERQKNNPYTKKDDTPEPPKDVKEPVKKPKSDDPVLEVPPLDDLYKFGGKKQEEAPAPKAVEPKAEPKAEQKPEPKAEQKPEPKAEQKPEPKAEQKPEPKAEQKQEPKVEQKGESAKPAEPQRYTVEEYEKLKASKQIYDGTQGHPGYDETHKKLSESAIALNQILSKPGGPANKTELDTAVKLANEAELQRKAEAEILTQALKSLDGVPGTEKLAQEYGNKLKANETCLAGLQTQLQAELLKAETKKQTEELKAVQQKAEQDKKAAEEALKAQQNAATQSKTQYDATVRKDNEDRDKWSATVKQEELRHDGARTNLGNQYPKPEDAIKAGTPYELLDPYKARAKMNEQKSMWKGEKTEHDDMANVAERQRMGQWRQLADEVKSPGRSEDKSNKEKLLYDAVTKAGKPFSSSFDLQLTGGGIIQNHGSAWTSRAAEAMVATCDPSLDRKIAVDTVPLALTNNNVPESSKLKLLDGLKKLGENGADGKPAITREQEIAVLTRALEEDRKKNFEAVGYASSMNYKNQQGFKDSDKRSQVEFQAAVIKRLGELKAVEATDLLAASASHANPTIARAARETIAKIHPTVAELRRDVVSDPLVAQADRHKAFDEQFAHPRADKRAAAVIRAFGSQQISDAKDPGYAKLAGVAENPTEDATVRLAAASVLSKSTVADARSRAQKVAADMYCTANQIPQYSEAAATILKDTIPDKQAVSVGLADGRTVIITRQGDNLIFK
ncbi:MAG: hypothetical protein JST44_21575 [Cyanobacteria bacterium SZAS LIN-5]|nr:hypothetical protein [Cyanobacteria bacterium SZAS LIN-5]